MKLRVHLWRCRCIHMLWVSWSRNLFLLSFFILCFSHQPKRHFLSANIYSLVIRHVYRIAFLPSFLFQYSVSVWAPFVILCWSYNGAAVVAVVCRVWRSIDSGPFHFRLHKMIEIESRAAVNCNSTKVRQKKIELLAQAEKRAEDEELKIKIRAKIKGKWNQNICRCNLLCDGRQITIILFNYFNT